MFSCPELLRQLFNMLLEERCASAEHERLVRALLQKQRRQRLAQFYCALARRMIAFGTQILNRFDETPAVLWQHRV